MSPLVQTVAPWQPGVRSYSKTSPCSSKNAISSATSSVSSNAGSSPSISGEVGRLRKVAGPSEEQLPPMQPLPPPPLAPLPPRENKWFSSARSFFLEQFQPLCLVAMIALGLMWPEPAIAAAATPLSKVALGGIFFITGLGLDAAAVSSLAGPRTRWALAAGVVSILALSPLASLALTHLPLQPIEFSMGLALFWAMPTSASSGVMIVQAARGDPALAVALTIITNVLAVFTAPGWAASILGAAVPVSVSALLTQLAATVLAPLAAGWALRAGGRTVPALVARHKLPLRLAQSVLLALVPWQLMGTNAAALAIIPVQQLALLIAAVAGAHLVLLGASAAGAAALPAAVATRAQRTALTFMSAQKTVMLAAAMAVALPPAAGFAPGMLMLPAVLGHLVQTLIDSVVATVWGRRTAALEAAESAAASKRSDASQGDDADLAAQARDRAHSSPSTTLK